MKSYRPLEERPVLAMCAPLAPSDVQGRDPKMAVVLSICPGLGQVYNGEIRKGVLLLSVFITNVLLFLAFIFHDSFLSQLSRVAAVTGAKIDPAAVKWLATVPANTSFLIIYACLILVFVAYVMQDAYEQVLRSCQFSRPQRFPIGLSEAASSSYLFHFTVIITGLLIMLFVAAPKEASQQITDIQLVSPPPSRLKEPEPPVSLPKEKPLVQPPEVHQNVPEKKVEQTPVDLAPAPVAATANSANSANSASETAAGQAGQQATTAGSGGTGTASPSDTQEADFGPYLADLQKRIKKSWFPPRGNESKRITVKFKIHKDGDITGVKLEKSSGFSLADDAALEAVEKAAPLPPLPPGADSELVIKFTFDYNVFNGGAQSAAGSGAVSN